jgi:GNAT superfamily N-acetyltransferase
VIDISFCKSEEIPALVEFIRGHWKRDHIFARDSDFLRWHYDGRRAASVDVDDNGLSFLLARDSGRIIGMLGLNEVGFNVFGERRAGVWTSLWYVRPEYRTQAVGARLWQKLTALDYDAISMMGMNPAVQPFFRSLGYELLVDTPRWCGILNRDAAERLLACAPSAVPAAVDTVLDSLCTSLRADVDGEADGEFEVKDWTDSLSEAWDAVWRRRFAPSIIGSDRPAEYIAWRYIRHPIYRYRVRCVLRRATGDVEGMIVTRKESPRGCDERVLRIVELLGERSALRVLAAAEMENAKRDGVAFADYHAISGQFAAPLEDLGFQRVDADERGGVIPQRFQPLEFGKRPLTSAFRLSKRLAADVGTMIERGDFYVSRADGDQDRPS